MEINLYCTRGEARDWQTKMHNKTPFDFDNKKYIVVGYCWTQAHYGGIDVTLQCCPYKEPPKPKSEEELQLEQTIKLTQQDIEHKNHLIEQYEEKRAALEKQRLEGV